jgi:hypothetical protein
VRTPAKTSITVSTPTPKKAVSTKSESEAQMQIVNEILKKNPDLLKNNKVCNV